MASSTGLVWKVALGVFLGGSALLLATCGVLGVARHAAMKEQERAGEALARKLYPKSMPIEEARSKRESLLREEAPKKIPPGYRCINGQAFRRVEKGWVQVSSSCTP